MELVLMCLLNMKLQTHAQTLHIAAADGAPGLDLLVNDIAEEFGVPGATATFVTMDDNNTDWNPLYPFSSVCRRTSGPFIPFPDTHVVQFLSPYKLDLPEDPSDVTPLPLREEFIISAENDTRDSEAGTRSFTLKIYHPGVIWTGTWYS